MSDLIVTTTFRKIRAVEEPIIIIQGGQTAGKNYATAQCLFLDMAENKGKPLVATILGATYPKLRTGAIKDFESIFYGLGMNFDKYYNRTNHILEYNNSKLEFISVDNSQGVDAGKSQYRDILYINEANLFTWAVCSGYIGRTALKVYLDFNPDTEFWAHTELPKLEFVKDHPKKSKLIIVTYKDNEYCPEMSKSYIESRKDNVEWYRVYGLGLTGFYSDRQVYKYEYVDEIPKCAKKMPSGMDFGVSPDPTCLVELWLDKNDLYCDLVFEENGLMPEKIDGAQRLSIVDRMNELKVNKDWRIYADSAGAVSIRDLKKHGFDVRRCSKKNAGSQTRGISQVRGYNLKVTRRSPEIAKAIEKFFFKVDKNRLDKNGNQLVIPEPSGHEPDTLAALRYAVASWRVKPANSRQDAMNLIPI